MLTIRQSQGACAAAYPPGTTLPVCITPTDLIVDGTRSHGVTIRPTVIETEPATFIEQRGDLVGKMAIESFSISVEEGIAVGGDALYSVTDEAGTLSAGSYQFSLAAFAAGEQ